MDYVAALTSSKTVRNPARGGEPGVNIFRSSDIHWFVYVPLWYFAKTSAQSRPLVAIWFAVMARIQQRTDLGVTWSTTLNG